MSGQIEQGMRVIDYQGLLVGNVRDYSSASFLLSRPGKNEVTWVSRSVIARVEPFNLVLSCGANEVAAYGLRFS